jgi:hypothetical protein
MLKAWIPESLRCSTARLLGLPCALVALLATSMAFAACKFGASVQLGNALANPTDGTALVSDAIGAALQPLGYSSGYNERLKFFYYEIGVGRFAAKDRVSVSWTSNTAVINLSDYRNFNESEFDKATLDAISAKIEKAFGETIEFKKNSAKGSDCIFGP